MKFNQLSSKLIVLIGLLSYISLIHSSNVIAAEELVFATPPTQSAQQTLTNYQPLVDYLSKASGKKITIKPAKTFYQYARDMRAGKYDLVFDGPHFIKYRLDKLEHVVLAKQPGDLRFVIVVKNDSPIRTLNDLITKGVCSPSTPHLGTLTFLELFPNPMRQPELKPVQGFGAALNCIDNGKSHAAVLRDKYWNKRVKNKDDYRVIHMTERKMPARGVTISSSVDKQTRSKIAKALVDVKGNQYLQKAFSTIGGSRFVVAQQREYDGLEELLQIIWGFHI